MPRTKQLTKEDFIKIGERFHSTVVLQEARLALQRWAHDLPLLSKWGWGQAKHSSLQKLVDQLHERQTLYAAQVGAKLAAVPAEAALTKALRDWCLRGLSILEERVQESADVAKSIEALGAEVPYEPAEILTYANGLFSLLVAERPNLDPEAAEDSFFAEGKSLLQELPQRSTAKISRRDSKEVATSELDELDGRIHDLIARLNQNARRALRQAEQEARASQYVFSYLRASPAPAAPEVPAAPPSPDA